MHRTRDYLTVPPITSRHVDGARPLAKRAGATALLAALCISAAGPVPTAHAQADADRRADGGYATASCAGDCNGDGRVSIAELMRGVKIALRSQPLSSCPALDLNGDGRLTVEELLGAVKAARFGCPPKPTPTPTREPLCAHREGGALVTFDICGERFTVWVVGDAFIDEAIALLSSGGQRIPSFGTLLDGTDCDLQWTWHPDPAEVGFTDFAIELCDGCPSHIEADKPYWLGTVDLYCPWSARVIAVHDRR